MKQRNYLPKWLPPQEEAEMAEEKKRKDLPEIPSQDISDSIAKGVLQAMLAHHCLK